MSLKQPVYGISPLKFFSALKEEKQFDYIFAAWQYIKTARHPNKGGCYR
ncbi:hypothetical protein [Borreliella valaisiana]|uniref:Uncharacterized protein n=1 Tax=Borreliella valaisiana VS116 TaxID=445987 RepID=C0R8Y2_BORVA|nr:conserved hypothetical protein [Borreliella valaisiana VS116]